MVGIILVLVVPFIDAFFRLYFGTCGAAQDFRDQRALTVV